MPGDLAASRLQDLTNADKYTMKIGGDTQKIASVSSSNNTLMITFKSSDVFGNLVNGSNQPTFFWEDVNTVHINEISPQKNTGISSQSGTQDTFGDLPVLLDRLRFQNSSHHSMRQAGRFGTSGFNPGIFHPPFPPGP
jgi:hypothetical protein